MNDTGSEQEPAFIYAIRLKGILSDLWSSWFDGMTIRYDAQVNTTLTGTLTDQAALHGTPTYSLDRPLPLAGKPGSTGAGTQE